jgi:ureidoacrylate peracid hydrolase
MTLIKENFEAACRVAHVQPFGSLREKVGPRHTALLVIDMQNDFISSEGLIGKEGVTRTGAQEMATRLPAFIADARAAGVLMIFIRNVYSTKRNAYLSDAWLEQAAHRKSGGYTRIPVCEEGTWGCDYYGEVRPQPDDIVVTKHRYSGFYNTELDIVLRANGIRSIILTGVGTAGCVETTAREGFIRDYYVVLVSDGTAAQLPEDQESTERNIRRFFGDVASMAELRDAWEGTNSGTFRR